MNGKPIPSPSQPSRLRVLVVTELFPNKVAPTFAIYNKLQCVALSHLCDVDVRAVIPWFPAARLFHSSPAGRFADVPAQEEIDGLRVRHPRFLFVPKLDFARPLSPVLYAASLWPQVRELKGLVDVVLGCWAFPDGIGAILLAKLLGAASAVKVHGSDLNVLPREPSLRRVLSWGLPHADRLIAVSRPLAERAVELGVRRERVAVVANGLDRDVFRPRDRTDARRRLGMEIDKRWILYVGRLEPAKGVLDLLEAFAGIAPAHPDLRLAMVGDGPANKQCRELAGRLPGRVVLTGALDMASVAEWIGACDILTLPSWNEGMPNVVLEAFACGRRVVASRVGGVPEVVSSPKLGELVPPRDVPALASALARAAYEPYSPGDLTAAAPHGWPQSATRLLEVLEAAAARRRSANAG
jgi:glycosyltransferase involved in cell wall biosynthesis